ncbi:hypothetical protein B9G55_05520 [Saccharibacillus sp. O16]|nr:hypothetical protein B9G55_05520 [Saccharibacillus sp. O16]
MAGPSRKLRAKLDGEGENAVVTIPVSWDSDVNRARIGRQALQNRQDKSAAIVLQTDHASYTLASKEIQLSDVKVILQIARSSQAVTQRMTEASTSKKATMPTTPYDFQIFSKEDNSQIFIN